MLSLYQELTQFDIIERLEPLFKSGFLRIDERGIIKLAHQGMDWDTPWVLHGQRLGKKCHLWQPLAGLLKFVPRECMQCWKVVVRIQTFRDLLVVDQIQQDLVKFNIESKCGVERRAYTHSPYGAYFYTGSLDEGRDRYRMVSGVLSKNNIEAEVILKRYCTEYEMAFGGTKSYERPIDADQLEDKILRVMEIGPPVVNQPDYLVDHVKKTTWVKRAWQIGDKTVEEYLSNRPLYYKCDTYHEEGEQTDGIHSE